MGPKLNHLWRRRHSCWACENQTSRF